MAKKSTRKHRFNLVDFFIIIALAIAIAALTFALTGNDLLSLFEDKVEINYILSVDAEYDSLLCTEDVVFTQKGKNAGAITSKQTNEQGQIVLRISASAYYADKDLFVNGQLLEQGEKFTIKIGDQIIDAVCCSIIKG